MSSVPKKYSGGLLNKTSDNPKVSLPKLKISER